MWNAVCRQRHVESEMMRRIMVTMVSSVFTAIITANSLWLKIVDVYHFTHMCHRVFVVFFDFSNTGFFLKFCFRTFECL